MAAQQLFAQFFWRIIKIKEAFDLKKVVIGFYLNPIFFSPSEYWTAFREKLFSLFEFKKGFLFPAGDFADVKDHWGVGFVVLESRDKPIVWDKNKQHKWTFDLKQLDQNSVNVLDVGQKNLWYWPPQESMSNWIRVPIAGLKLQTGPQPALSSALKCSDATKESSGFLVQGALGYMVNVANNVYKSIRDVWMASAAAYMGHGLSICPQNFERCVVNFAARHSVIDNWMTHVDEFHIPSDDLMSDKVFLADCVVFSIFNIKSSQSSVSNMPYKGNKFSFRNQWFPWSKDAVRKLAQNIPGCTDVYDDTANSPDSFVYTYLSGRKLSKEAKAVLDKGWKIVKLTFDLRPITEIDEKRGFYLHMDRWDAGWYQIKRLIENNKPLSKELKKALADFDIAYAELAKSVKKRIFSDTILLDNTGQ